MNNEKKHTRQFRNFVKELISEEHGRSIASESGITGLEILFERTTGKSPWKNKIK